MESKKKLRVPSKKKDDHGRRRSRVYHPLSRSMGGMEDVVVDDARFREENTCVRFVGAPSRSADIQSRGDKKHRGTLDTTSLYAGIVCQDDVGLSRRRHVVAGIVLGIVATGRHAHFAGHRAAFYGVWACVGRNRGHHGWRFCRDWGVPEPVDVGIRGQCPATTRRAARVAHRSIGVCQVAAVGSFDGVCCHDKRRKSKRRRRRNNHRINRQRRRRHLFDGRSHDPGTQPFGIRTVCARMRRRYVDVVVVHRGKPKPDRTVYDRRVVVCEHVPRPTCACRRL